MSSGSSKAIIANKMFELRSEIKEMLNKILQQENLTETEKAAYNEAVNLYQKQRYGAAKEKLKIFSDK